MKEVAIVANNIEYSDVLKEDLNTYFNGHVNLNAYSLNDVINKEYMNENYIVLSSFTIFQKVKSKITRNAKLTILSLSLDRRNLYKLNSIPPGSKALLVNIDYRTCMQVITMLFSLGYQELDLIPYYDSNSDYDKSIKMAITPGESQMIPKGIDTIIDLGQRMISFSSIVELATILGIKEILESQRTLKMQENIADTNISIEKIIGDNTNLIDSINNLIELMEQGIIITDITGKITMCNNRANEFLMSKNSTTIGLNIFEVFPDIYLLNKKPNNKKKHENVFSISGVNMVVSSKPILSNSNISGYIITIDRFEDIEKRQHNIRTKISGHGHNAVFKFNNILGCSDVLLKAKNIAKRIAKSNSSVLIIGESGTGKELFAQAIHNASSRSKYNFVAINCATLPGNLLESELFGYEEGAFSGAKKGGKIGLIELAHNGTLFLDEVAEMPIDIQAKLLRVLEEQRYMKLGGKDVLSVDIRIISATNKKLINMVRSGSFRSDLYYRLNVLPLELPNLKVRKDDIMFLFIHYQKILASSFSLTKNAENAIINYDWPGNVRELKNTVEYLTNLGTSVIDSDYIPFLNVSYDVVKDTSFLGEKSINYFILDEGKNLSLYYFILDVMEKYYKENSYIGRDKIFSIAMKEEQFFGLSEIKYGLSRLNDCGFIKSYKGRKGSIITKLGIKLKIKIKEFLD